MYHRLVLLEYGQCDLGLTLGRYTLWNEQIFGNVKHQKKSLQGVVGFEWDGKGGSIILGIEVKQKKM